jgi:hypothetical protein
MSFTLLFQRQYFLHAGMIVNSSVTFILLWYSNTGSRWHPSQYLWLTDPRVQLCPISVMGLSLNWSLRPERKGISISCTESAVINEEQCPQKETSMEKEGKNNTISCMKLFCVCVVLRLELRAYTLSHSTRLFLWKFSLDRVLQIICLGWLQTTILLISVSWVAMIAGLSHQHLAISYWIWVIQHTGNLPKIQRQVTSPLPHNWIGSELHIILTELPLILSGLKRWLPEKMKMIIAFI